MSTAPPWLPKAMTVRRVAAHRCLLLQARGAGETASWHPPPVTPPVRIREGGCERLEVATIDAGMVPRIDAAPGMRGSRRSRASVWGVPHR
jgi:hypothetical protein